jgi:riboflavin synthase alpha subunit
MEQEHLLNFVVNSLDDELPIDLGENVEVTTEKLYEVLAGASAGETSINRVCETTATRRTPTPSVDISPTSLNLTRLKRLETRSCNEMH